jgi:hypothetical protein
MARKFRLRFRSNAKHNGSDVFAFNRILVFGKREPWDVVVTIGFTARGDCGNEFHAESAFTEQRIDFTHFFCWTDKKNSTAREVGLKQASGK